MDRTSISGIINIFGNILSALTRSPVGEIKHCKLMPSFEKDASEE
jgi:hypothetical protein